MRFRNVEPIKDMRQPIIIKAIKNVRDIYAQGAFKVMWLLMDGQFEPMQADEVNLGIRVNAVAENDHIREVKHYI